MDSLLGITTGVLVTVLVIWVADAWRHRPAVMYDDRARRWRSARLMARLYDWPRPDYQEGTTP